MVKHERHTVFYVEEGQEAQGKSHLKDGNSPLEILS